MNKIVKKSIKKDKLTHISSLTDEADEAARKGNLKQLYDTTRKLSSNYSKPQRPVKDKDGNTIKSREDHLVTGQNTLKNC